MLLLSCPSKLQMLEGMLKKCLPQAIGVHGTVMNINRGNPLGHEVIVDTWPNFKAVLTRPHRKVASDDSNCHVNTYAAFYHDLDAYRTLALDTDAINWAQSLQIQGNQQGILEVSQEAVTIKNVPLTPLSYITFLTPDPNKMPEYRLDPGFTVSTLNASHVDLVNETWAYGGNEQSRRYIASLVQAFFSFCILDPNGQLISWNIMNHAGAIALAYTLPSHRGKHYFSVIERALSMRAHSAGYPVYRHVALSNVPMQRIQEYQGGHKIPDLCHYCIHGEI
ncbi:glycine N-acyltransferase-like protein 3 [Anolis sagrei]|uniref:glycine N-acyltransferase-like protein 3 n=1 Tax=Anolis sagrei TaxID=38937 RepID=UPI00352232C9